MRSTPHRASSSKIPNATSAMLCRICGKPVPLETSKADGNGKAIHEDCYALKVKLENATKGTHEGRADGVTDGAPEDTGTRPWKVIAEEVSREQDSAKLSKLVQELNEAMEAQGVGKPKK